MTQQAGIRVFLRDPEDVVDYPKATSATAGPGGKLVILRARQRQFPEALDEIPRDRWRWWTPLPESDPTE